MCIILDQLRHRNMDQQDAAKVDPLLRKPHDQVFDKKNCKKRHVKVKFIIVLL